MRGGGSGRRPLRAAARQAASRGAAGDDEDGEEHSSSPKSDQEDSGEDEQPASQSLRRGALAGPGRDGYKGMGIRKLKHLVATQKLSRQRNTQLKYGQKFTRFQWWCENVPGDKPARRAKPYAPNLDGPDLRIEAQKAAEHLQWAVLERCQGYARYKGGAARPWKGPSTFRRGDPLPSASESDGVRIAMMVDMPTSDDEGAGELQLYTPQGGVRPATAITGRPCLTPGGNHLHPWCGMHAGAAEAQVQRLREEPWRLQHPQSSSSLRGTLQGLALHQLPQALHLAEACAGHQQQGQQQQQQQQLLQQLPLPPPAAAPPLGLLQQQQQLGQQQQPLLAPPATAPPPGLQQQQQQLVLSQPWLLPAAVAPPQGLLGVSHGDAFRAMLEPNISSLPATASALAFASQGPGCSAGPQQLLALVRYAAVEAANHVAQLMQGNPAGLQQQQQQQQRRQPPLAGRSISLLDDEGADAGAANAMDQDSSRRRRSPGEQSLVLPTLTHLGTFAKLLEWWDTPPPGFASTRRQLEALHDTSWRKGRKRQVSNMRLLIDVIERRADSVRAQRRLSFEAARKQAAAALDGEGLRLPTYFNKHLKGGGRGAE